MMLDQGRAYDDPTIQHLMEELARLVCRRTQSEVLLDGSLDAPEWRRAARAELMLYAGGNPAYGTVVRTLWSASHLYVGFECEDPEPAAKMSRRDDPLFQEGNVVELFVDPAGDGTSLFEFEVNPLGTLMDLFYAPVEMNWNDAVKWNANGARAAARIIRDGSSGKPTGWTAELAVPLENFHTAARVPPRSGDVWRVNFYRYNTVSTLPGDHLELSAWSPTFEKRFNLLHRFGFLEFA